MNISEKQKTILVVDDNPIIFEGILSFFNHSTYSFLYQDSIAKARIILDEPNTPNIILLDLFFINQPMDQTIRFCKEVKRNKPEIKILSMSSQIKPYLIRQLILAGSNGFFLKTDDLTELACGFETILDNTQFYSATIRQNYMSDINEENTCCLITTREIEIIRLISEGHSTTEMADKLFISPYTVENHRANILQKLKVNNSSELIRKALNSGLI